MIREPHGDPQLKSAYQIVYDSICVSFVDPQVDWEVFFGGGTEWIVIVSILF
jgi:hypothetical protein